MEKEKEVDVLIQTVDMLLKRVESLEKGKKQIEREIKFHWRLLSIFLFLNAIVLLEFQIVPVIVSWIQLCQ